MKTALIVAGGTGSRMANLKTPKQFVLINGKPLIVYTIEAFQNHPEIDKIIVVCLNDYLDDMKNICEQYQLDKVEAIVPGGNTRQLSVSVGLKTALNIGMQDDDIILIHDGARPLVTSKIISKNIEDCKTFEAVDTVIRATDTIIKSEDNITIGDIPNRNELYQSQTPQTFKYRLIVSAHNHAIEEGETNATDDATLVLKIGHKIHLVEGNKMNFKITTDEDLKIFESLTKSMS